MELKKTKHSDMEDNAQSDIHRTGAKCVQGEEQDPRACGSDYHVVGPLRTKPGRGDPTLSMCCSDKMLRWTVLGVQGCVLSGLLLRPVYLTSITVGSGLYSHQAMHRALIGRFEDRLKCLSLPSGFSVSTPVLLNSTIEFPFSKSVVKKLVHEDRLMVSPTSIVWFESKGEIHEVGINGIRLGVTKKQLGTSKSWLSICRKSLLLRFKTVLEKIDGNLSNELSFSTYHGYKHRESAYQNAWCELRNNILNNWKLKPDFTYSFDCI